VLRAVRLNGAVFFRVAATSPWVMSELMFVEVVRRYLAALPAEQTGWLAGLRDRIVGRALALLHARPGEPWTLETLAKDVGLSRSALADAGGGPPPGRRPGQGLRGGAPGGLRFRSGLQPRVQEAGRRSSRAWRSRYATSPSARSVPKAP
jgi:hypothetical protein